jgi:G3E family GTPase
MRSSDGASRPLHRSIVEELDRMVKRLLTGSVYRCKGIVYASDDPQRPYALQIVGRRVDFSPIDSAVASADRISEIVAIGRNIDGTELDDLFAATLA